MPTTVKLTFDLDRNSDAVFVDGTQIQTVFMNLISNAVDSLKGENGEVNVSLSKCDLASEEADPIANLAPRAYAQITVRDNGQGMSSAVRQRIFDPFFSTKPIGEGTGLGLSSAYGILQNHGGAITCESEPGTGSVFRIYLPMVRERREAKA